MGRSCTLWGLLATLALTACAGPPRAPLPAPTGAAPVVPLAASEERFLRRLGSTDARLASRLDRGANEGELADLASRVAARGAREGGLVGRSLDPFAFEARAAELALAHEELLAKAPLAGAAQATLGPEDRDERALATELFVAEAARARREKDLTTFGGDLLAAAAQIARDATTDDEVGARDAWLAERLGDVNDAMVTGRTSAMHRRELADALDPVERGLVAAKFPRAFAALAKLRETVGEAKMMSETTPLPAVRGERLDDARALVGERLADAELVKLLVRAEQVLGAEAKAALAKLGEHEADRARASAGKRLALRASCRNATAGSLLRRLPAPREREAGCLAVRALASARAEAPLELAEAWVLLHDRVAAAVWSAVFHAERATLDAARGRAGLLSLPEESTKSALLRRAAVRPADTLGAGLVAALVVEGDHGSVERAQAVVAFGDAPVATVRAHLDSGRRDPVSRR